MQIGFTYVDFRRACRFQTSPALTYGDTARRLAQDGKLIKKSRFPSSARTTRFHAYQSMTRSERSNDSGAMLSGTIMRDEDVTRGVIPSKLMA